MSYAIDITKRAKREIAELETWLQEETWDELDYLAKNPPNSPGRSPAIAVYDFVREQAGVAHYIFITYTINQSKQAVHIASVALFTKRFG